LAAEKSWLEISLSISGELAEAVAEVLDRFVVNGVVIESLIPQPETAPEGTQPEEVRVVGYLPVDAATEEKRVRIEEALWHLGQIMPLPPIQFRTIADEDWMTAWKKNYSPILVGKRLQVVPAWMDPPDPKRITIKIDPSMAFGTGTHPSTQLCLEHLETYVMKGQSLIDVGCGSGILSIAAIELGASHALAVDIDPLSVKNTQENSRLNKVTGKIEVGLGSIAEIVEHKFSISQAPLVVVNILSPVIISLFDQGLADLVSPHGTLILAGILEDQFASVDKVAQGKGMHLIEKRTKADWVSPVYKK
jgi:ribosomal protein L11 methyltransferase